MLLYIKGCKEINTANAPVLCAVFIIIILKHTERAENTLIKANDTVMHHLAAIGNQWLVTVPTARQSLLGLN